MVHVPSQELPVTIRPESPGDAIAVATLVEQSFQGTKEVDLVEGLRQNGAVVLSLVAVVDKRVVGHILFSPVTVASVPNDRTIVSLAPLAVSPEYQRRGIGSRLSQESIAVCRQSGMTAMVVVGHPEYYPRFGFVQAATYGLECPYINADHPAWMALELVPGGLDGKHGMVTFDPAFDSAV